MGNEGGQRGGSALVTGGSASPSRQGGAGSGVGGSTIGGGGGSSLFAAVGSDAFCGDPFELEDALYTEKYVGNHCAMCNPSERSTLGQGDIMKVKVTDEAVLKIVKEAEARKEKEAADKDS